MTRPDRHEDRGGWVNPDKLPKGPGGRPLCRWCEQEIPPGRRRTFCSQACVDQHVCRTGPSGAAQVVRRRDHGVCAICGLDCAALRHAIRYAGSRDAARALRELHGIPPHRLGRLWDVDHIVPVVEGGGSCGPENLRTLCCRCHRACTAELRARRAKPRTP